ncbi:hypothetical protein [Nocardia sp. MW-W600-9]
MSISRVPEPALVRSILVTVSGVIAFIVGKNIDVSWIEPVMTLYGFAAPLIAGLLIRPAVTPVTPARDVREE